MNSLLSYRFISINNLKHKCFYLSYKFSCIFSTKAKMKSLQMDYTDAEIFGIFVGGGFTIAFIFCIGICTMFHGYVASSFCNLNKTLEDQRTLLFRVKRNSKRRSSKSNVIKEQSESVVRGDHPLTFVLPTVSLSETDRSEFSDLDGITSTEYSSSTSLTGVNEVRSSPNPQDRIRRIQRDRYTTLYNEERRSPRSKFRRHSR